eukprot:TRINITY_DN1568_c0_g1_i6.p1 TRINITY_DN1568_c0_g1~~TRINITY_DN1568_c0_g1_i6.p1  ORF type:complete len:280 (+),score=29.01 TRINITY_DN1568_c0_g1_i6:71-910(+)
MCIRDRLMIDGNRLDFISQTEEQESLSFYFAVCYALYELFFISMNIRLCCNKKLLYSQWELCGCYITMNLLLIRTSLLFISAVFNYSDFCFELLASYCTLIKRLTFFLLCYRINSIITILSEDNKSRLFGIVIMLFTMGDIIIFNILYYFELNLLHYNACMEVVLFGLFVISATRLAKLMKTASSLNQATIWNIFTAIMIISSIFRISHQFFNIYFYSEMKMRMIAYSAYIMSYCFITEVIPSLMMLLFIETTDNDLANKSTTLTLVNPTIISNNTSLT